LRHGLAPRPTVFMRVLLRVGLTVAGRPPLCFQDGARPRLALGLCLALPEDVPASVWGEALQPEAVLDLCQARPLVLGFQGGRRLPASQALLRLP
jgi:hypothetical protein